MAELQSDQVKAPSLATAAVSTAPATPPAMPASTPPAASAQTPNLASLATAAGPVGGAAPMANTSEPYPALKAIDAQHFGLTPSLSNAAAGKVGTPLPVPAPTSMNLPAAITSPVHTGQFDEVSLGGKG